MLEIVPSVVCGVEMRTYRNAPQSLSAVFDSIAATEREALVYLEDRYSYAQLKEISSQAAAALSAMGIAKGDRVAVAMRNLPEYVFLFWACQQIGVVLVGLNAWWTRSELEYGLGDCDPKLLVVDQERCDRLHDSSQPVTPVPMVVVRSTATKTSDVMPWMGFLAKGDGEKLVRPTIEPDDPATMLYTSGTTGKAKGVIGTHRNHASTLMNTGFPAAVGQYMAGAPPANPADAPQMVTLMPMPMFHVGGIHLIYAYGAAGAKMVLMYKWDADVAAQLIERERVMATGMVPTMLRQLIDSAEFARVDHSSLLSVGCGAAPVPPDLAQRADELGIGCSLGYGLTETNSGNCGISGLDMKQHPGSIGRPHAVIETRIVDEAGNDVAPGLPGELWLKGPNISTGYWNQPEATADSFPGDGWFRTGDVARQDDDGFMYLVDRIKDMIIRGGENIYCGEVEGALMAHPAVREVAVIGLPDSKMGEQVVAVVIVNSKQSVDEESLIAFSREQLAYFKAPTRIVFRSDPFERTSTGKLLKTVLKKDLLQEGSASSTVSTGS